MKKLVMGLLFATLIFACSDKDSDDDSNSGGNRDAATTMNDEIILPPASFWVDPDSMEITTDVTIISQGDGRMPIDPNGVNNTGIQFEAPNGNVTHGGIRFGDSGPIIMAPVETNGSTTGTITIPFTFTSGICDDIATICHDVKCYEFAMTDEGEISAANIMDVALLCGACDEPSCQDFCCEPGELKIVSHNITIDGEQPVWGNCDVNGHNWVSGDYGAGFTVGENAMFDEVSYRISFGGFNLNGGTADILFYSGQTISSFTQSGGFDIQLDPPMGSGLGGWHAMDYSGSTQGTVVIDAVETDEDDQISSIIINFNNVICEDWLDDENTRTINGTITAEVQ